MSPTTFSSDRSWTFALSPEQLWDRLTSVEDYDVWWPWLQRFQPVGGFQAGARWACSVSPPLLRSVGAAMRPVVEWGHDWVLDQGQRQFVDAALDLSPDRSATARAAARGR